MPAAQGWARSEAAICMLLQRKSRASRVYASVLHVKVKKFDEDLHGTLLDLDHRHFVRHFNEFYSELKEEAGVGPEDLDYLEAEGSGTKVCRAQGAGFSYTNCCFCFHFRDRSFPWCVAAGAGRDGDEGHGRGPVRAPLVAPARGQHHGPAGPLRGVLRPGGALQGAHRARDGHRARHHERDAGRHQPQPAAAGRGPTAPRHRARAPAR